jgi:hypothetical protein
LSQVLNGESARSRDELVLPQRLEKEGDMANGAKRLLVYTIVEKPGLEKPFWVKVGSAFPNRDESLNVYLDALPTNGRLHIREKFQEPDADQARS